MNDLQTLEDPKSFISMGLSVPPDLPAKMSARARVLDMNRSQYVRWLFREDVARAATEAGQEGNTVAKGDRA